MQYLAATLHTLGVRARDNAVRKATTDPERGSVTIENVIWAVAVIAATCSPDAYFPSIAAVIADGASGLLRSENTCG